MAAGRCTAGVFLTTILLSALQLINANPVPSNCDPNCAASSGCAEEGPLRCDRECEAGYILDTETFSNGPTYTCKQCDPNCDSESGCSTHGPDRCDTLCKTGWGLDDDTAGLFGTFTCRACDPHCHPEDGCMYQGPGKCDGLCIDDWVLDRMNTTTDTNFRGTMECLACDPNCISGCDSKGPYRCDGECDPGYGLDLENYICNLCDTNCDSNSGCKVRGPGKCDELCNDGWALDEGTDQDSSTPAEPTYTCKQCGGNCSGGCSESGPDKCDGPCNTGWAVNSTTKTCEACQQPPACAAGTDCSENGPGTCVEDGCDIVVHDVEEDVTSIVGLVVTDYVWDATSKTCLPRA